MCSRAGVLKAAADILTDGLSRRTYEKKGMVDIVPSDLPGDTHLRITYVVQDAAHSETFTFSVLESS